MVFKKAEPVKEEVVQAPVKKQFEVVQVATQHGLAFQTPEGEVISSEELLVKIANTLEEVKKGVIG